MKSKIVSSLVAFVLCSSFAVARAELLSFNDSGIHVDGGSMGTFDLEYPVLEKGDGKEGYKIIEKTPSGATTMVKYDGGAILTGTIGAGGAVTYSFAQVPADVKNIKCNMMIDFSYQQGGKWKVGDGTEAPFPVDKPAKPHLYQNNATQFQLTNYEGKTLNFKFPDYSYLELQDNREWNWSIFDFIAHFPVNAGNSAYSITISSGATQPGAKPVALVDELGQIKALDWPDKVKSIEELKADVPSEQAYYASLTPPVFDKFGGLPDSGKKLGLQTTGFFHVEKKGEKWMLVDPDGNLFFHLGVCGFSPGDDYTTVTGRRSAYDWLPPVESEFKTAYKSDMGDGVFSFHTANMIRKYGKPYNIEDFQSTMIDRVRKWGFNSIGAFSPITDTVVQARSFPYVGHLPTEPWGGKIQDIPGISGAWDPFDPANVAQLDVNFQGLSAHADDPLLIGYFLTNEPLYEDIPKVVPTLKSDHACKVELVKMLSDKYQTIDAFNKAWGTSVASFDALNDTPLAVNTKEASEDMHAFTGKFFETYYKLVADTFHKYDTHHMLIGNRFQPGTINNEQLCRICGKYLDVMSFNYYTDPVDKDFVNRIYGWTGRPMFFSEFYWSSGKESGLSGGSEVGTEQNRGLAYRNYVEQSASLGYVVGIEWFTLIDQAATGRWFSGMSGERANTGLFSVTDRPWKPMLAEMMKTNYDIYNVLAGTRPPYVYDNPLFTQAGNLKQVASAPHATGAITVDGTTKNWPGIPPVIISGKRVVIGADAGGVEGSYKLCWDENNLYVLVTVIDPTPLLNKQTNPEKLWSGDGIELFFGPENIDQGGALQFSDRHLVIGATAAGKVPYNYFNSPRQYATETLIVPGSDGKSYTLEAAIPWQALGLTPKAGTEILFDIGIDDSVNGDGRQRQLMWNGTDKNSSDRTHWGHAKLLE